jgi:ZIP family zinc transporter
MMLAAGGILYLIFQDIAPAARLEKAWAPPLGAVLGFLTGLAGHLLIGVN